MLLRHSALPELQLLTVSRRVRRTQLWEQRREHLLSQPVMVQVLQPGQRARLQLELRARRQANLLSLQVLRTKDFGTHPPF